jgi:hypothetical protein
MFTDVDGHPFEVPEHLIDEIRAEACNIPPERWPPGRRKQIAADQRELIAGIIAHVRRWHADGADIDAELQERLRATDRAYQECGMPENISEIMLAEIARIVSAYRARLDPP